MVSVVVVVLGLLLGGAIAGWPARVKNDVVIEGVTSTTQPADSTSVGGVTTSTIP